MSRPIETLHRHHQERGIRQVNINIVHDESTSFGSKIADDVAKIIGSWKFIIVQSIILTIWVILNSVGWWLWKWDLYPFIAMNLLLSCQAAYAAPVILMSQNRQAAKDRLAAENDYHTNVAAKEEIELLLTRIDAQDQQLLKQDQLMLRQHQEILTMLKKQR